MNRLKRLIGHPEDEAQQEESESGALPPQSTLREVRRLFDKYADEVDKSNLSQSSKVMYIDFADCFVRWMYGGFHPGLQKSGKRRSNIVK